MRRAILPGSFDPPTLGHINIIERTAALFDELHVIVADNIEKKSLFTPWISRRTPPRLRPAAWISP